MHYLFDIDGTLRNFESEPDIAPSLYQVLTKIKRDNLLSVVTGRTYNNYNIFLSEVLLASNCQANINELFENVYCEDGHILYRRGVPISLISTQAQKQMDLMRKYIESLNLTYPSPELRGEVAIVIQEKENEDSVKTTLETFVSENNLTELTMKQLTHNRLSISVKGINKRVAIELSGIELDKTIYFCDEQNDLELTKVVLEKGGKIVCPSNAIEEIKTIASFVSSKPHSYGVVDYLSNVAKNS